MNYKKYRLCLKSLFSCVCLCVVISGFTRNVQATETISTGDMYPPYVDKSLPNSGLLVSLVEKILDKTKDFYDMEFVYEPWARGYEQTREGVHLGTFPYLWGEERAKHFHYSDSLIDSNGYLFVRDEIDETEWTAELLAKKGWIKVCRPNGYSVEILEEPLLSKGYFEVYQPSDLIDCFRMLQSGRVDVVPVDKVIGEFTLFHYASDSKFKTLENHIYTSSLHFIVSKQRGDALEIIRQFNKALKEVNASGEATRIKQDFYDQLALDSQ